MVDGTDVRVPVLVPASVLVDSGERENVVILVRVLLDEEDFVLDGDSLDDVVPMFVREPDTLDEADLLTEKERVGVGDGTGEVVDIVEAETVPVSDELNDAEVVTE